MLLDWWNSVAILPKEIYGFSAILIKTSKAIVIVSSYQLDTH